MSVNENKPGSGDLFRARRIDADLSQEQAARAAGCSTAYMRILERGYLPPWAESPKLRHVAELLGLTREDLESPRVNGADPEHG